MRLKCVFTFVSILIIVSSSIPGEVAAQVLTLYDTELWDNPEFGVVNYGPATFTRGNPAGEGVIFNFAGLTGSATGVEDNYPVSNIGQILPSHGNGDFSNFSSYELFVTNLDDQAVGISLYLSTGFTGASGNPSNDWTNDTFWQSQWVTINPGQLEHIIFDFSNAVPWNIEDNKYPHTQGTNGFATAINDYDRREVSTIGFQVADFSGVNPDASVLVAAVAPEPVSSTLFLVGAVTLGFRRFRKI